MFSEPSERHHVPHFHAYYQDDVAVFSISPIAVLGGSISQRQQRLVEAWAELHQEELLADWDMLRSGKKPARVEPLR
ncbi:MAG: DUF4160 domain-containing protein [Verrucomicrobia bacterium]|nr:MAG: DUF4160 domain-containing protein [Verrucomicrobiota bacterium]